MRGTMRNAVQASEMREDSVGDKRPHVAFPVVPFWTGCPLPFSPMSYPQVVLPSMQQGTEKIGPEMLRPVTFNHSRVAPPKDPDFAAPYGQQILKPVKFVPVSTASSPAGPGEKDLNDRHRVRRSKRKFGGNARAPPTAATADSASAPPPLNLPKVKREGEPVAQTAALPGLSAQSVLAAISNPGEIAVAKLKARVNDLETLLENRDEESEKLRIQLEQTQKELMYLKARTEAVDDMFKRLFFHAQMGFQGSVEEYQTGGNIYSPFRSGNAIVDAFREKVDLTSKKSELRAVPRRGDASGSPSDQPTAAAAAAAAAAAVAAAGEPLYVSSPLAGSPSAAPTTPSTPCFVAATPDDFSSAQSPFAGSPMLSDDENSIDPMSLAYSHVDDFPYDMFMDKQ